MTTPMTKTVAKGHSDPRAGKYVGKKGPFNAEFLTAIERLAPLGGVVSPGVNDYEAFVYDVPGLRMIFYPHRTTARNYHIRMRPTGKVNGEVLRKAIYALAENTCTFQCPSHPELHGQAVRAALRREMEARK